MSGINPSNRIQVLFDFFQILHAVKPSLGFASALNLSSANLIHEAKTNPSKFSYCDERKRLTFKYQIPSIGTNILRPIEKDQKFPLSGFMGLIDIVTTWGLVQHNTSNAEGRRFGVSLQLNVELGPAGLQGKGIGVGDTVDVEVGVLKMGRTVGFTTAEIRNPETGQIICTGRHTKYLSTDKFTEMALGRFFPITRLLTSFLFSPTTPRLINVSSRDTTGQNNEQNALPVEPDKIFFWQSINSDYSRATVLVESYHLNETGALHGGVSAMLMEKMGEQFLLKRKTGKNYEHNKWHLKSISASYLSSAQKSTILYVEVSEVSSISEFSECITTIHIKKKRAKIGRAHV